MLVQVTDDRKDGANHFGGALANVAVAASRTGARAGLAGAAGDDEWGRWLAQRLEREGVEPVVGRLRNPASPAGDQDGLVRRRLAYKSGDTDQVGSVLHIRAI